MTKPDVVPFCVNENDRNLTKNGNKRMSKPMMEKRRRARINDSLSQLKEMVIDSGKQNIPNSKSKLEKADILEMTVKHVKELQHKSMTERKENTGSTQTQIINDVMAGFAECAKIVEEFLYQNSVDPCIATSLTSHLNACITSLDPHDTINSGVIRHTGQCCPPSPAPSTMSSASGGRTYSLLDMEVSSISSADEDMPLNLSSSNRFSDHFHHQMIGIACEDGVWRPW